MCSQKSLEDHIAALPWELQGAGPIRDSHFLKLFPSNSHKQSFILFWNQVKRKKKEYLLKGETSFQDDVYSHKDRLHSLEVQ